MRCVVCFHIILHLSDVHCVLICCISAVCCMCSCIVYVYISNSYLYDSVRTLVTNIYKLYVIMSRIIINSVYSLEKY